MRCNELTQHLQPRACPWTFKLKLLNATSEDRRIDPFPCIQIQNANSCVRLINKRLSHLLSPACLLCRQVLFLLCLLGRLLIRFHLFGLVDP